MPKTSCPIDLLDLLLPEPGKTPILEKLSTSDKEEIAKLVKKEFKDKDFEDLFLKLYKNATTSFYNTMYTRKSLWRDALNVRSQ